MIKFEDLALREIVLRIGLITTASLLYKAATAIVHNGVALTHPISLLLSIAFFAAAVLILVMGLLRPIRFRASWLILPAMIGYLLCSAYVKDINYAPAFSSGPDNERIGDYSAEVLRAGVNPYTWDYTDMLRVNRDSLSFTPFTNGAPQHKVTYPALPTLAVTLLHNLGIMQGRAVGLVFHVVLLVTLFVAAPRDLRPLILLPLAVLQAMVDSTLFGVGDVVWSALLVLMLVLWRYRIARALLYGLAATYRQQPWFIGPFLLIQIWNETQDQPRRQRFRALAQFLGISIGVFALLNLPFFLNNPQAWLASALEPSYAQFTVDGVGLNAIWRFGYLPLTRSFFTGLQLTTYLAALFLYWRHGKRLGTSFWIIPALFFWLYYRSLTNYWYYWVPPLLYATVTALRAHYQQGRPVPKLRGGRLFGDLRWLLLGLLLFNGLHGIVILAQAPAMEMTLKTPIETFQWGEPLIENVELTLTNDSSAVITPRFFGMRYSGSAAYPWKIERGPLTLEPGESGAYAITADRLPQRMLVASTGGQIILEDAAGNYALRQVLTIPPVPDLADTDLIANAAFTYWNSQNTQPIRWSIQSDFQSTLSMAQPDDRPALAVVVTNTARVEGLALHRISQTVVFPEAFDLWLYPPAAPIDPQQTVYGVGFDDGTHRLWLLYGDTAPGEGDLSTNEHYMLLPASPGEWSRQHIDLSALYKTLGWPEPLPSLREVNHLEFYAPQVTISLLAGQTDVTPGQVWFFGALEQDFQALRTDKLLDAALDQPFDYYYGLAQEYMRQRNYTRAEAALRQAMSYDPSRQAVIYFELGELLGAATRVSQGPPRFDEMLDSYRQAIDSGYQPAGMAYKGMGWGYLSFVDTDSALDAFQHALDAGLPTHSDEANVYAGLSITLRLMSQCDQSASYRAQALAIGVDAETQASLAIPCDPNGG